MSASKAFVVGWPIGHSRSPLIHRHWLRRHGLAGDYVAEAVPPEAIAGFLGDLGGRGYVGGNVTVPHKEAAFAAVQERTAVAARLGAVNTVWLEDGRLCGDNTDVFGFLANLDEAAPDWRRGGQAVVLGAGGAARAVAYALAEAGFAPVWVLNRSEERAEALVRQIGAPLRAGGLAALPARLAEAAVLVNTTSAGMAGSEPLAIDWSGAGDGLLVTDIVYVPLETPFLAAARRRGLRTVDGLGMLLHQARPGFERWFGLRPDADAALRRAVLADLGG